MTHPAGQYPVRWLCRVLGCPRAGLYRTPAVAPDEARLRAAVERVAGAWPTHGHRRVTAMLRRDGRAVNAKRVRAVGMAAAGEPEENGYAERLMRTIKEEEVGLAEYRDYADARRQPGRSPDAVYDRKRTHSALGYLTPAEFEQQWRADRRGPPVVQ